MSNNKPALTPQQVAIANKQKIEHAVTAKIAEMAKSGGIALPRNYNPGNQITLALLELSEATVSPKDSTPLLSVVDPSSVAQSLFRMVILGMSLDRKQCAFIKYGDKLRFQLEYHGRIALAKRLGGADEPRAQVIYEGDEFEYMIDTRTGNKVVTKHTQKLGNIDNAKIVGAWALVPYKGDPERQPFVEIMSIDEIRAAWNQGATRGGSPAHLNFTQEMAKKTVIGRACKLFISTSDDSGMYDYYTGDNDLTRATPEEQETPEAVTEVHLDEIPAETVQKALADPVVVDVQTGEVVDDMPADDAPAPAPAPVEPVKEQEEKGGLFNNLG